MRRSIAIAFLATTVLCAPSAWAQFDPFGNPAPVDPYQTAPAAPDDFYQPAPDGGFETPQGGSLAPFSEAPAAEPPAAAVRVRNPVAAFSGLDKITGRITSFDVVIDETIQFGALQVTPRECFSAPPEETPKTDSFVEIDEVTLDRDIRRIFTGWMFADSPGLNAVEHPVYDVWLRECRSEESAPDEAAAAGD